MRTKTENLTVIYSEKFHLLDTFFKSIEPPYNLEHIEKFNAIYRRIYADLTSDERRRSEQFVDKLIEHLEKPEWASKIFGVF